MVIGSHKVLIVGFEDADALRIVSILGSFDVDLQYAPWDADLIGLVTANEYDAILIPYPKEQPDSAVFLEALRAEDAQSRRTGVIAMAAIRDIDTARRHLGSGLNRVVPLDDPNDMLSESVLALLGVARRFQLRAPVELWADFDDGTLQAYCNTENISMSGMLVSCSREVPIGTAMDFKLAAPGEENPIRGSARVARQTDPRRERIIGIAATFQSLSNADRSRLRGVLSRNAS